MILFNPACNSCECVAGSPTYVGGEYTTVDGVSRLGLARLNGDGSLDMLFSADISDAGGNASIKSMVYDETNGVLYVGGNFDTINGVAREGLAALDPATGAVLAWTCNISTGIGDNVNALLLVGSDLYVGGVYTTLGGSARVNGGVVSTAGVVGSWHANTNGGILCLAHDAGIIYFGGPFTTVAGGTARNRAAAMSTAGVLQSWNPNVSTAAGFVNAMAIDAAIVYMVGRFATVDGSTRNNAAAYSAAGVLQSWNPNIAGITPQVRTIAIADSVAYLGGTYNSASGSTRDHLSAFHVDGTLMPFGPSVAPTNASGSAFGVYQLIVADDSVYCIGVCSTVGGLTRNDAFVIGTDGVLADWHANLAGGNPTGESIIAA